MADTLGKLGDVSEGSDKSVDEAQDPSSFTVQDFLGKLNRKKSLSNLEVKALWSVLPGDNSKDAFILREWLGRSIWPTGKDTNNDVISSSDIGGGGGFDSFLVTKSRRIAQSFAGVDNKLAWKWRHDLADCSYKKSVEEGQDALLFSEYLLLISLGGLDNKNAWKIRDAFLGVSNMMQRSIDHKKEEDFSSSLISHAYETLEWMADEAAMIIENAVLESLVGVDSEKAWEIRKDIFERRKKYSEVLQTKIDALTKMARKRVEEGGGGRTFTVEAFDALVEPGGGALAAVNWILYGEELNFYRFLLRIHSDIKMKQIPYVQRTVAGIDPDKVKDRMGDDFLVDQKKMDRTFGIAVSSIRKAEVDNAQRAAKSFLARLFS